MKIFKVEKPSFFIITDSLPPKKDWDSLFRTNYKYSIETWLNDSTYRFLKVRVKNKLNKKGYFQLLIFHLEKENFCRYSHSGYGSIDLIFSKQDINNILNSPYLNHAQPFTWSQENKASKINYNPEINFLNEYCYISVVSFNNWRGFQRLNFRISKDYPNDIVYLKSEVLMEYNVGVMF